MKNKEVKSAITIIMVTILSLSFIAVVILFCNENIANQIVSTFLTIVVSVVGFYIGYQNTKKNDNDKEEK